MLGKEGKKGQVTIFIIIAILVIALAALAYFLIPNLRQNVSVQQQSPTQFIDTCMREKIVETIETTSLQGGSYVTVAENSYFYRGNYVKYLCYSKEDGASCINQEPFLKEHVKQEIKNEIQASTDLCFEQMVTSYQDKGYTAILKNAQTVVDVEILPERIVVNFDNEITLTKGESENYDTFYIRMDNNLYELLDITKSIVSWEIDTGDAPIEAYTLNDPYIKPDRKRETDDTKIYILTDRRTDDVFQFAVRSWANSPGY